MSLSLDNKVILGIVTILGVLMVMAVIVTSSVKATVQLPSCGTETYEFYQDGSNSRVSVDVHDSDEELDATGLNGWSITGIDLDQEGGSKNYSLHLGAGNRNDYNPSNFGDIGWVKVEVNKPCPTPTQVPPTPTPTQTPKEECEEGYVEVENECVPEPTPTEQPRLPDQPLTPAGVGPGAPVCTSLNTILLPLNAHVLRHGQTAEVKWNRTESDQVNIYYVEGEYNALPINWTHAVRDEVNDGYVVVGGLNPSLAYTFGLQQKGGCAGGPIVVIPDGPIARLFRAAFYYWQQ